MYKLSSKDAVNPKSGIKIMTKANGHRIMHQWKREITNEINKNALPTDYYAVARLSDFLTINIQPPRPEDHVSVAGTPAIAATQTTPAQPPTPPVLNVMAFNKDMQKYTQASSIVSITITRHLDDDLKRPFTRGLTVFEGFGLVKTSLNHEDTDIVRDLQLSIDNVVQGHNESALKYVERFTDLIDDLNAIRPITDQVLQSEFDRKNAEKFLLGMDRDDHKELSLRFAIKNITTITKMEEEIKRIFSM
jgi:hypothetical protein